MKKEITQFDTKTKYFLDEEGYLYGRDGKMKSTSITLSNGKHKTFSRDKWIAIVFMGAPIDKKFYTYRNRESLLKWSLSPTIYHKRKNTYIPEIDDFCVNYIYFLCDKKDGQPRYVGKTYDQKKRLESHIGNSLKRKQKYTHKQNWIRSVYNSDSEIEMVIIDQTNPDGTYGSGDWTILETYWGNQFLQWGFDIIVDGGWGNGGDRRKHTEEEILANRARQAEIFGVKTYIYDIYNKTHEVFDSISDGERYLVSKGVLESSSALRLNKTRVVNGEYAISDKFFTNDELYEELNSITCWDRRVLQMDMSYNNVISEYNTAREAKRVNKCTSILSVLDKNKNHSSSIGFRWVYKLDYVYKGVDFVKSINKPKRKVFTYTNELIDDCISGLLTFNQIIEKHKNVSKGTIGNIKKNPKYYRDKVGKTNLN